MMKLSLLFCGVGTLVVEVVGILLGEGRNGAVASVLGVVDLEGRN